MLSEMPDVRACYVAEWLRFSQGKLNSDLDRPYVDWLMTRFTRNTRVIGSGGRHRRQRHVPVPQTGGRGAMSDRQEVQQARAPHAAHAVAARAAQGRAGRRRRAAVAGADAPARPARQRRGPRAQAVRRLLQPVRHHPRELAPDAAVHGAGHRVHAVADPVAARAVQERHRRAARHELRVVAVQVRSDRQRARPGDDAHVDGDRRWSRDRRARGARTTSSTDRRAARRSTSTSRRRSAARRCCRRWSSASRAPTRSWRRWSRTCATAPVDENDQVQAGDSDPAGGRSRADLRAPDGQHAGRDDRTDPGGAAEPAVGARLRQERLRRSDGPARQRRPRQAGSAPDQRPRHRDARRALDLEPDLGELPRHHDAASDAAAAAGVPARSGPARSRGDRDAGHELLRHELPRDRPDADGPDDPRAAVRSDAGGEPAVVDRREHGDPRVAAAGVPGHARAPHDDAQRERRRVGGWRRWSIRRRR